MTRYYTQQQRMTYHLQAVMEFTNCMEIDWNPYKNILAANNAVFKSYIYT